jgi:hypothetical protein
VGHAFANRFHHTSTFHAQAVRQWQRVQTGAMVDIDVIQTDRFVRYAHLAGAGFAHRDICQLQNIWTAGLFELNGFAHA